jgi:MFS family permease
LPGSVWLDLFWPLFGLGVAAGALITIRFPAHWDRRRLLMGCYALQAIGIMLGVLWPSLVGFALGSLLVGLPFTAITLFAMQEVRRVRPLGVSGGIGLLTAVYGLGQIAGPPWVAVMLAHSATTEQGFALSLETAAGSLLLGIALYAWLIKKHPMH